MKIAFQTLGCKLNYAETSTYERGFKANGLEVVNLSEEADLYLLNTCSVTEHSEKKARNIIRKLHRQAPDAKIIITGCYAELKRKQLEEMEGVALVFGAKEKNSIVSKTMQMLRGEELDRSYKEQSLTAEYKEISKDTLSAFSTGERTRSFLKVQDGCNNFCAYCTIPFARGQSRNIPICELVKQAEHIANEGVKEIVLTGINTGDFGRSTGESFLDLLKALNEVEGIERYRISSIEPNLISSEIVDWIASGTKFLPHFHIPLQTGNDELLKSVGRKYDTALFAERIDYIRKMMDRPDLPKVFLGIDVIVGLPGETEEKFMDTYNFLKDRIKPAFIHLFPYSKRPGTKAAQMSGHVQDSEKTRRMKMLEALCLELNEEFEKAHKGYTEKVLWENKDRHGNMLGYTRNYIKVQRPYEADKLGKIEEIII